MAENKIEILVTAQDTQMGRAFGRMGDRMRKLGTQAGDLGRSLAVPAAALIGLAAVSLKSFASFEKQLVRAGAVSNATAEELNALETAARDMGRTTIFTATQSAEALAFLAMAGNDAQTSIEALPSVLQLAAAGSLELGQAADIVTNVMAGMQLGVEELGHANDVLVTAFTSANTNLQQLGQAFKFAGPVASAAGVGFEETAAALALMGNAGIQATMAGTSLRGAITRMLNPSKEAAGIMKDLGVQVLDTAGNLLPLTDIIRRFEERGLSAADAMTIFGLRAGPGMLALVSQGSGALEKLTKEMEDSGGTAKRISDAQLATFAGQMLLVKSAVESVAIELGKALVPAVTNFVDSVRPLIASMEDWIKQHPDLVRWIGLATVGMAALAAGLIATSILMPGLIVAFGALKLAFSGLMLATKLATAVQWLFNVAVTANPFVLAAVAIVAAVAGIVAAFIIFRDKVPDVFAAVGRTFDSFLNKVFLPMVNLMIDGFNLLGGSVEHLEANFEESFRNFGERVERGADKAVAGLAKIKETVMGLVPSFDLLSTKAKETAEKLSEFDVPEKVLEGDSGSGIVAAVEATAMAFTGRLLPALTEAQEALVLAKLASIGLRNELGPLNDAMNLLADKGLGVLIRQFADGIITQQELIRVAAQVRAAMEDETETMVAAADVIKQRLVPSLVEMKREMVQAKLSAIGLENEIGPLREAMSLLAEKGLGVYIRQLQEGMLTEQEFIAVAQDVREAMVEIADVISERLIPGLTEAQSALVLDKLAALELDPVLGHLKDAMNVLAEEGLGSVIQKLADGTIGKYEFLQAAQAVRDVLLEENAALKEQEARLAALKVATAEMKDASRIKPGGLVKTAREIIIGWLGGLPIGLPNFAVGGTVGGPVGAPQLAVVHGGETITPAGRGRGAQNVLNITNNFMGNIYGIDDLDEHIRRTWRDTATRGGFDGLVAVS